MKRTKLAIVFKLLLCFLLVCPCRNVIAQNHSKNQDIPKPILKNGKFIFYNSLLSQDTKSLNDKLEISKPTPVCIHCSTTLSSRKSTITGASIILYITTELATCGYRGSIVAQAANGVAPYSFALDGGPVQPNGNFPTVGSYTHTLVVTDATGASVSASIDIGNIFPGPMDLSLLVTQTPSSCTSADGVVQLQATGGTPPYSYTLDLINFQTSNIFSNLRQGFYEFFVRDANGCLFGKTVFVPNYSCNSSGFTGSVYSCHDDGLLTVYGPNPPVNGPYQYSLDGSVFQSSPDFTNIPAGVHQVSIKDILGNVQTFGYNVLQNCQIDIQYISVSAACMQNDGSLEVTAINGTAPYSYTLDGINYQSSNIFSGLAPGNYSITVKDANGDKSSLSAVVYDKCPVVRAVSSGETCIKNDGIITAAGFKGTAPYQFSRDGISFQSSPVFSGLSAGTYEITIKDAYGFTSSVQVSVEYNCLSINAVLLPSSCGSNNGSIVATAVNGTAPYQYSIDGTIFQVSNVFNNLLAGTYTITGKDANDFNQFHLVIILNIPGPNFSVSAEVASCLNNDGIINVSNPIGVAPFQYAVNGGSFQSIGVFSGLDTGMKMISVQDANGCTITQPIAIPLNNNLFVDAGSDITICEGKSVSFNATSNGESFLWSPAVSLTNAYSLNALCSPAVSTKYYLKSNLNICMAIDSVTVIVNPAPIANAGVDTVTCYGKSLQLKGSGGVSYSWSSANHLDNPNISNPTLVKPLSTETFQLIVKDMNNCMSIQPASVTVRVTPPAEDFPWQ